jgi:hypothetical protein
MRIGFFVLHGSHPVDRDQDDLSGDRRFRVHRKEMHSYQSKCRDEPWKTEPRASEHASPVEKIDCGCEKIIVDSCMQQVNNRYTDPNYFQFR